ncbi:MAG: peptidase, partial [Chloroflexi bacterium]|nr:peptidase [Chloroflexota bacterium]
MSKKNKRRGDGDPEEFGSPFDAQDESSPRSNEDVQQEEFGFVLPETQIRALSLIDDLLRMTPRADARFQYLLLLRHQISTDEQQMDEAKELIQQYEEAYNKLTAPANRIGVFLGMPEEGIANVVLGDSEFYANADPKLDLANLKVGTRVTLNEAYALLKDLGYSQSGPIVKVGDVLDGGRLRVSMDAQGMSSRIVHRSADLMNEAVKTGSEVRMDPTFRVAVEHFPAQETRDFFMEEVPPITWEQVGGQEDAIALIRDTIELPLLYPQIFERFEKKPLKGILLFGPPGCGKTLIGKATAYN